MANDATATADFDEKENFKGNAEIAGYIPKMVITISYRDIYSRLDDGELYVLVT